MEPLPGRENLPGIFFTQKKVRFFMKRETLEKIRNILEYLFELFIFILIMLITFGSLHVHAASNPTGSIIAEVEGAVNDYCNRNIKIYSGNATSLKCAILIMDESNDVKNMNSLIYTTDISSEFTYYSVTTSTWPKNPQNNSEDVMKLTSSDMDKVTLSDGTIVRYSIAGVGKTDWSIISNTPCYDPISGLSSLASAEQAKIFLEHLLVVGDLKPNNGGSDFDPHDDAYAFTGFSMSGKTATWTGTTKRSYLLDMDVEEWVNYTYGFATSEDQEVSSFIDAEAHYPTSDKKLALPWDEMEANKKEGEFIRQVNIIPCYGTSGAGFYFGSPVCVYFDAKGNIEKVIHKSKPTDLNKGNMVYDSSIGYLQNVIYTEQKTHDGTGRQATFKWSTQKSLPSDAQVEIVVQNFYIEWFNKKTEENFIFKEYGEDCFYSAGSYSFNANTPVWTWLKEKEIDPFSIKTQSYGSTEYYLRIVIYDESDLLYHYGGWVKVDIKSKDTTNLPSTDVETGGFDDSSGLWNQDTTSSDSYHYSTDDDGKLTGNIDVNSWEDLNMNSFTWMYRNMQSMVSSLGEFPTMVNAVFGYLPVQYITAIGVLLVAIVLLRFLGR